ncbi:hypothetical protein [Sphingobium quisquiliarum]|uniref:hypothetical protein n=1 Tax=Sphingobium quisquiliarum TaxID=538379 RepID=UPI0013770F19|nr:hypothetical protein [Sphingobium quisquiliarum]
MNDAFCQIDPDRQTGIYPAPGIVADPEAFLQLLVGSTGAIGAHMVDDMAWQADHALGQ